MPQRRVFGDASEFPFYDLRDVLLDPVSYTHLRVIPSQIYPIIESPVAARGADQRDKNADNAPAYASYLMIRATRGSRILDYRVYLGENSTTDFNVGRNTCLLYTSRCV